MNLLFLTRGMKWHRDKMIEELASLKVPMEVKDTKGNKSTQAVNVLLQPVELWSLAFPRDQLDNILRTIRPSNAIGIDTDQTGIDGKNTSSPKLKWLLAMLRKVLKLKKIPKWNTEGKHFGVYKDNVQTIGVGIKEDYFNKYGNECL